MGLNIFTIVLLILRGTRWVNLCKSVEHILYSAYSVDEIFVGGNTMTRTKRLLQFLQLYRMIEILMRIFFFVSLSLSRILFLVISNGRYLDYCSFLYLIKF